MSKKAPFQPPDKQTCVLLKVRVELDDPHVAVHSDGIEALPYDVRHGRHGQRLPNSIQPEPQFHGAGLRQDLCIAPLQCRGGGAGLCDAWGGGTCDRLC